MQESNLEQQAEQLFKEFLDSGHFKEGQLIVIGRSEERRVGRVSSPV